MFALDLFNTDHERRLAEGAVDQLEQRRIDDLAMKMDDLVARAKDPAYKKNPAALAALMKEFQKCKAERDSYYTVRNETMGYGSLGEAGIGQDVVNKQEKMARATPSTPTDKVASTVKNAAKWLAGKGGPGKEGPTYESQKKNSKEVDKAQLTVGDPIVVTGPNEFEGKTGEIHELSPSGAFVVVDLYNHGQHSMHLSDVKYNDYADQEEADDWYDNEMEEGYAASIGPDVAPLSAEKQWKIQVRQIIADYGKNPQGLYNIAKQKGPNSAEAIAYKYIMHPTGKITMPPGAVTFEGFQDFNRVEPYAVCLAGKPVKKFDYYQEARRFHDNWKQKLYREGDKAKADTITLMPLNLDEEGKGTPVPAKDFVKGVLKDLKKVKVAEEGRVDPLLIRALERMPDGLNSHGQVLNAAYDAYAMELGEDQNNSGVERAILNRIMVAHTDLLMKFGPEKVMQAAEEVAYNVGDVDEIGTSDVSAYVHQVKQILGAE